MITTLDQDQLCCYLSTQLEHFFPDGKKHDICAIVPRALERLAYCLGPIKLPLYRREGQPYFNHLHSEQYATFLYFASSVAWADHGDVDLAAKLFGLNKALNGIICMYDTVLPDIFLIAHSVGIMLGKASYNNYLVVHQNVTVGTDRERQPRLGQGVVLFGGAAIIGDCDVGANVSVSAGSMVLNAAVPGGHVVAGRSPDLTVRPARRRLIEHYFDL